MDASRIHVQGFPGSSVVKNQPTNVGGMSPIPDLGGAPMSQSD